MSRLIRAHRIASESIRARLSRIVERQWDSLDDYRQDSIEAFARRVSGLVLGAQRDAARLEQAYLARLAAEVRGEREDPGRLDTDEVTGAAVRNGADPREVYARPGKEVWTALAAGAPLAVAASRGRHRAVSTAQTDVQLARTHTARRTLTQDPRVTGYRRVLSPLDNCDLCIAATAHTYGKGELMPLHDSCACDVAPIYGGAGDPSGALPEPQRTGELAESDLITRSHGETGPKLARRDHRFTGPAAVS